MTDDKRDELLDWLDRCVQYATGIETTARGKISEAGHVLRDRLETDAGLQEAFNRGYRDGRADQRTKAAEIAREERVARAVCLANREHSEMKCLYPKCNCRSAVYNQARAAIEAMQRWRPINEADEQHEPYLVGWDNESFHSIVSHREHGQWGWLQADMTFETFKSPPTHFMPIPKP